MSLPTNILVATDFGACSDAAVERAFALATTPGAKVHVLHVFTLDALSEGDLLVRHGLRDAEGDAKERLRAITARHVASGRLGEVIFRTGDPASLINLVATQLHADLVVVGTHGRRGLANLLIGSVAARVVRGAPCSVWVARPREGEAAREA